MNKALLIIDVQNDYFEGGKSELHSPLNALANIEQALSLFRLKGLPVIHVQHINTRAGAAFFLPDTDGAMIHKRLTPKDGEYLVVKHVPNSFLNTNLSEILKGNAVSEVIVCGMMSHMCVDTTVRACMDYGLKATLLEDACATKDIVYRDTRVPAGMVIFFRNG